MQKKSGLLILSLLSAAMLSLAWYWHLTFLVFFAWLPLLIAEQRITSENPGKKNNLKVFGYAYLTFFTWNILVTWWVVYASFGGACMAFVFNSLFMSLVFTVYSGLKRLFNKPWADWLLIPLWIAWEHWHTIWDLTWTWLTLGNVFAFNHNWVQWYEFTGTSGGTLWILGVNILVYRVLKYNQQLRFISKPVLQIASAIIVPVFLSYLIFAIRINSSDEKRVYANTVIVQPNIDPYNDKFNWDFKFQFNKSLKLLNGKLNNETDYLVFPETFITENFNEEAINQEAEINWFRDSIINNHPKLNIVTGANTYVIYEGEKRSATARRDERGFYYDVYNTALLIDRDSVQIYHKSKLVPGVERMPFPALLKPLESLAINMGGTMGSLGTQNERSLLTNTGGEGKIAPVVCYESIFADYVTEYVRLGANLIFIITNDGWWDNTPGFVQHLNYARLRAIENRREIARCANTGISCFIDQYGNTSNETEWWKEAVIEKKIQINSGLTFFSANGDLLSYASVALSLLVIFWAIYLRFKR